MSYYIYQRISTEKQSLIRQEGAIGDYCKQNNIVVSNENIFSDVITGKTIKREHGVRADAVQILSTKKSVPALWPARAVRYKSP
jgi:DNA invertase Pin-like site-specific DNA recombinase